MAQHIAHRLPPAPQFVGRDEELAELRARWKAEPRGVIALVGLGGAGKTALAARFLQELERPQWLTPPDRLFVWSFYQEPDADRFLTEAYRYFARFEGAPVTAKGTGLFHLLREALSAGGPNLLVLDGLERVQQETTDRTSALGRVEDPLLRGLLMRIAEGAGQTVALVTSRFPLTDLQPFQDRGYRHMEIEGLTEPAALALLRRHGVQGDDRALRELIESYGAHALTLDHLGSLIGQFLGGDPRRAPEAPGVTSPQQDRQALRLARLLSAYETHLPPAELALLCRLCLLERTIRVEQIGQLFLCSPLIDVRTVRDLERSLRRLSTPANFPDEFPQELAWAVGETIMEVLRQGPIAGPEDSFRQNLVQEVADLLAGHEQTIEEDVEELIRLYGAGGLDVPTERRPLPTNDQQSLPRWIARYTELRHHQLLPYRELPAALELAFQKEGWGKTSTDPSFDVTPADVALGFRWVKRRMQQFALKHRALVGVRHHCRLFQDKWQASGPLATLDGPSLSQVLASLVARHLVLRESDGSVSVHPAVRDYFGRLATESQRSFWHHLIGEQLIRLVQRPGLRLPADPHALNLVEEAISHALAAGQTDEAWNLYSKTLGGHRHLAWKLGEMARGLRIVRSFKDCPDRSSLGWYLRALGELDEAYEHNPLGYFRADLRLLQGRLAEVQSEGDPARTAIADFLMGRTMQLPPEPLGCAIPRAQILLYLGGRPAEALLATRPAVMYETIGWEDGRTRCQLFRAEVASRMGDAATAEEAIDAASQWVLHSGSVEHLCLYHLVRTRMLMNADEIRAAERAAEEGLLLAGTSGLRLYQVDLLCLQAGLLLRESQSAAAEQSARAAVKIAGSTECQFAWGAARAGHLLGRSLIAQNRQDEARPILENVLPLRQRIGDSRVNQTEALLRELRR
jgi:AAA ATPase domain